MQCKQLDVDVYETAISHYEGRVDGNVEQIYTVSGGRTLNLSEGAPLNVSFRVQQLHNIVFLVGSGLEMCFSYSQQIRNGHTLAPFEVMFIMLFTLFLFIMCKLVRGYPT